MAADRKLSRRTILAGSAALAGTLAAAGQRAAAADDDPNWTTRNKHIKQSVIAWCFNPMPIAELCAHAAKLGLASVELVKPADFPVLKQHGLTCAILGSHGFTKGLNHTGHHNECLKKIRESIDAAQAFGCPNVITFSGMRAGLSDEEGIEACVKGLKKVAGYAEKAGVTICLEMLNSRVNEEMKGHPGYHCDRIEWALEVCEKVGSKNVKILFDFYHVQIMQGDVIARLKQCKDWIGHLHTAGVPGRAEIDHTQELNYHALMQATLDIGYTGFVGQEFIPRNPDKIASLRQAVKLCDI
jgi:hydroxypyruvate isomerase